MIQSQLCAITCAIYCKKIVYSLLLNVYLLVTISLSSNSVYIYSCNNVCTNNQNSYSGIIIRIHCTFDCVLCVLKIFLVSIKTWSLTEVYLYSFIVFNLVHASSYNFATIKYYKQNPQSGIKKLLVHYDTYVVLNIYICIYFMDLYILISFNRMHSQHSCALGDRLPS